MDFCPPMSQSLRLNPSLDRDLMLKPCRQANTGAGIVSGRLWPVCDKGSGMCAPRWNSGSLMCCAGALACVGVMVVMSSSLRQRRMVVLPALSRPSTRMRACVSQEGTPYHAWPCHGTLSLATSAAIAQGHCPTSPSFFLRLLMRLSRPCTQRWHVRSHEQESAVFQMFHVP